MFSPRLPISIDGLPEHFDVALGRSYLRRAVARGTTGVLGEGQSGQKFPIDTENTTTEPWF